MADLLDETRDANLQDKRCAETAKNVANDGDASAKNVAASARIKRMRGWLGVKSTSTLHGYDDGGGGVVYGDGHSGWNR